MHQIRTGSINNAKLNFIDQCQKHDPPGFEANFVLAAFSAPTLELSAILPEMYSIASLKPLGTLMLNTAVARRGNRRVERKMSEKGGQPPLASLGTADVLRIQQFFATNLRDTKAQHH